MGNSVSLSKTPQAKDDLAATSEDNAIAIDVLANDLGGNAKSLYSLDQSNPLHVATTALSQFGATIKIVDGKILYDPTGSAQLQALADGQTVIDTFSYAIRLANGTLSLATVSVTVNGANEAVLNHAPLLANPIADQSFNEDSAVSFTLPANTFTDADHDTLTYSAALVGGGALPPWLHFDATTQTFSGTPPQDFNGVFDIRVTASDATLSAFDDFLLTIAPVNDAPVFAAPVLGDPVIDESAGTGRVSGTVSFTDADLTDMHTIAVIPGSATGYAGTFTAVKHTDSTNGMTGLVDLNFFVTFAEVQALGPGQHPQTYTIVVNDGHGGTDTTEVTIPLGGGDSPNHDPVITVVPPLDSAFTSVVDNATQSILFRQGRLSFGDVDTQDTHFVNAVGNSGPSGTWGNLSVNINHDTTGSGTGGVIGWQYQVNEQGNVRALGANEFHVDKFDVMLNDNHGGFAIQTVTVRINGANDAPVVQQDTLVANITGSWTATGGPVALQFAQGINFSDFDLHDTHTASAVLDLAHSTVNPDGILSLHMNDTFNGLGGRVDWTYDLHDSSMPGNSGEQRKLTYNVTIDDGHGGVTVPFVMTFNSPPVFEAGPASGFAFDEGPSETVWNFTGNLAFTDVDPSDHHTVLGVFDPGHSNGLPASLGTFSFGMLNDTSNGTGGLTHWEYHVSEAALESMAAGDTRVESFALTINDGHGGIASHQLTVTIHGSAPPDFLIP